MAALKTIKTIKKSVYGKELIYPDCQTSRAFCKLLGVKTLTQYQILQILSIINIHENN